MNKLADFSTEISHVCRANQVKTLFAFGSVITDHFNPDSDIDLLVDIDANDPLVYSEHYFNLKFYLEDLLKRPVDLLEEKAVRNPFLRKQIDQHKVLLYGRSN